MANISNIKIGSTTYTIKDENAASLINLNSYVSSSSVLPENYYKCIVHRGADVQEMKIISTNNVTADNAPLANNTAYIVFAFSRIEAGGYYYMYTVYNKSDRKYVGTFDSNSGSTKRPTVLNKAFFSEITTTDVQNTAKNYAIKEVTTDVSYYNIIYGIKDYSGNLYTISIPTVNIGGRTCGLMSGVQANLLAETAGSSLVEITTPITSWLDDNCASNTTPIVNTKNAISNSTSDDFFTNFKTLKFDLSKSYTLKMGTSTSSYTIPVGTYYCRIIDSDVPGQVSAEKYGTFLIYTTQTTSGVTALRSYELFVHFVYKDWGNGTNLWGIERIGKLSRSL